MGVAGSPSCTAQRRLRSDAAAMSGRAVGILPSRIGRAEDQRLGVDEHLTAGPLTHPAQRDLGSGVINVTTLAVAVHQVRDMVRMHPFTGYLATRSGRRRHSAQHG